MSKTSQEELDGAIKEAFEFFDKDKSGAISASELREVLNQKLDLNINEKDSEEIVKTLDKDGSGQIDYDEFTAFVHNLLQQQEKAAKIARLNEVFRFYDKDGDGFITKAEIRRGLQDQDIMITDEELENMIKNMGDVNHDGKIDFEEFSAGYI